MHILIQAVEKTIFLFNGLALCILIFGFLNRLYVLRLYKKAVAIKEPSPSNFYQELPFITIQLPIYNEPSVVERLIHNICNIDYPIDKFEIQVLDDSTDQTRHLANNLCQQKRKLGINIYHICRDERNGYKAGALSYGLQQAKGEFVAIFDADFLPPIDFLKKTIHFFTDQKVGWVQTRWSHLNENSTLLTQCIALICDSMFKVESAARSKLKHWGIFNGAAGIIRREMIEDAGGWHCDTITEDSDLSYRALAKGWQYITLTDVVCPCELPPTLPAFVEQQIRWSKGNIQVVKKLFKTILTAKIGMTNKYDFISYLTNYLFFPAVTLFSILIMPTILLSDTQTSYPSLIADSIKGISYAIIGIVILFFFFKYGQKNQSKTNFYILTRTSIFTFMSLGLAPSIAFAVLQGFFNDDRVFIRTPKFDLTDNNVNMINPQKTSKKILASAKVTIGLGIYTFASILICCFYNFAGTIKFLPLLCFYTLSYLYFGIILAFPNQRYLKNIFEFKKSHSKKMTESVMV